MGACRQKGEVYLSQDPDNDNDNAIRKIISKLCIL